MTYNNGDRLRITKRTGDGSAVITYTGFVSRRSERNDTFWLAGFCWSPRDLEASEVEVLEQEPILRNGDVFVVSIGGREEVRCYLGGLVLDEDGEVAAATSAYGRTIGIRRFLVRDREVVN